MDKKKIALILLFIILLEVRFVYLPAKRKILSLDNLIATKQKDKETLLNLCEEYKKNTDVKELLKMAKKEFSLLSYTGKLIEKRHIEKNITGLQSLKTDVREGFLVESVQIGIKGITLQQLYEFLYDIEKAPYGIYISDFRMQKIKSSPHLLDAEIELFVVKQEYQITD